FVRPASCSTLFPYTTLFRSGVAVVRLRAGGRRGRASGARGQHLACRSGAGVGRREALAAGDEVEGSRLAGGRILHGHKQVRVEDRVLLVAGDIGKVQLCRQDSLAGRTDLDVDVLGATGIFARENRLEVVAAGGIGQLVAAQPVATVVVGTTFVRLPEVKRGAGDGRAREREHPTAKDQPCTGHAALDQGSPCG